ncbi:MAG: hypothetical protein ACPHCN_18420 [Mycobacterium sp.]
MSSPKGSTAVCKHCGASIHVDHLQGARGAAMRAGWIVPDHLERCTCTSCREADLRTIRTQGFLARQAENDAEYTRRMALREQRRDEIDNQVFAQGRRKETSSMAIARGNHEKAWSEVPNTRPGTH